MVSDRQHLRVETAAFLQYYNLYLMIDELDEQGVTCYD